MKSGTKNVAINTTIIVNNNWVTFSNFFVCNITFLILKRYLFLKNYILKVTFKLLLYMAHSKEHILKALAEIKLGLLPKKEIAKKYGVSKKTLWMWEKNPPGKKIDWELQKAQNQDMDSPDFEIIDNPVTTDDLEPIDIPEGADSLLVDQLVDPNHRAFVHEFHSTRNKTASWRKVYGGSNTPDREAFTKASILLRSKLIRNAIRQLNLLQIKIFESEVLPICIEYLTDLILTDVTSFYDSEGDLLPWDLIPERQRRVIQKLEKKIKVFPVDKIDGKVICDFAEQNKIHLPDKLKAIELLGRIAGMWHDTNLSINMTQNNNVNVTKQKAQEGMEILTAITEGRDPLTGEKR